MVVLVSAPRGGAEQSSETNHLYRPDIDGLRAIAVVAVIINHIVPSILPNGFLGVDIFFVISGFVITASLSGRSTRGALSFASFLADFYRRRIRRLVPALVVFVALTAILICLVDPEPKDSLATGAASLFGVSNIQLWKSSSDYFAGSTQLNIFTHTWSLGVEEQYYFLYPLLFWFSGFGWKSSGRRNLLLILTVLSVASFVLFLLWSRTAPMDAYFLTPARFWEMGAGCLLFLLVGKVSVPRVASLMAAFALLGMIALMFLPFKLKGTIMVVLLTTVLIGCNRPATPVDKILTQPVMLGIGKISYSLYLWHWVVICISRWTIGIHAWLIPLQIALMVGLATASYLWIEQPLRSFRGGSQWILPTGLGVLASVWFSLFGLQRAHASFFLGEKSSTPKPLSCGHGGDRPYRGAFERLVEEDCLNHATGKHLLVTIGDSHSTHLAPMAHLFSERGYRSVFLGANDTPFPFLQFSPVFGGGNTSSDLGRKQLYTDFVDYASTTLGQGDVVLISSFFRSKFAPFDFKGRANSGPNMVDDNGRRISQDQAFDLWIKKLVDFAEVMKKRKVLVVVMLPLPVFDQAKESEVNERLCRQEWFRPTVAEACLDVQPWSTQNLGLVELAKKMGEASRGKELFLLFDPAPLFCSDRSQSCSNQFAGRRAFFDSNHLNSLGASLVGEALLEKIEHSRAQHLVKR
ncbi:MAG: acyltransferase family protein [Cyanobacteriota bacterium]|jgi:peptidoglycan/LPS O-acetylase OafA/YrhL